MILLGFASMVSFLAALGSGDVAAAEDSPTKFFFSFGVTGSPPEKSPPKIFLLMPQPKKQTTKPATGSITNDGCPEADTPPGKELPPEDDKPKKLSIKMPPGFIDTSKSYKTKNDVQDGKIDCPVVKRTKGNLDLNVKKKWFLRLLVNPEAKYA
jgi:hypothetical protein